MRKKLVLLILILTFLGSLASAYVITGLNAYARYQQVSLANQEHCGGQAPVHICVIIPLATFSAYYPSYLANRTTLFNVEYSSSNPLTLVVSVSIQGFSQMETHT